jgi:hypothetical protein
MRKNALYFLLFVLLINNSVYSQVPTRIYKEGKMPAIHTEINLNDHNIPVKQMPKIDLKKLVKEDSLRSNLDFPNRFGKGFDTDLSLKDGEWTETSEGRIWNLKVHAPGAYTINLVLDELYLPRGVKLYIYNSDSTTLYGPVTYKQNPPPMRIF